MAPYTSRRVGLRSETSFKMQTRQSRRRARKGDNFQSVDWANIENRRYPMRSGNRNNIEDIELSDDLKSSEASSENQNNRKPTSAAAVSPTASLYDSDSEPRPLTFDDNKDKPISIDDINDSSETHLSRRISIDFMKELYNTEEENNGDSVKEIVWTKKIAAITSCSGNLIEDFDAECDESSTGSMTTIIGSEQSNSVGAGDDDLEGIFRLEDENDGEINYHGDDCGSVDSIHSKCFVLFVDGDEDEVGDGDRDDNDGKRRQIIGPKTSRINPMTGKRSTTDDMQEWRNSVLSSWTLLPPKEKQKYNTRKAKRERVLGQHAYQLRNTTDNTNLITAANSEDSRELHNIAPYNRPGIRDLYGVKSIYNTANETATKQEEVNLKQTTIRVRIGDIIFVPDDEKDDGLQVAARIIKAKESANKPLCSESGSEYEKPDLPLPTSAINNPPVSESRKKCNKPDDPLPTNGLKLGSLETRAGIEKNKSVKETTQTRLSIDWQSRTNGKKRPPSSLRERDVLPQKKKKRKNSQGLQIAPATLRPTTNRSLEVNPVDTTKPSADEKLRSLNRKQKKTSCQQPKLNSTKRVQKNNEMPLDLERSINHSTRIAKKFLFNPTRRECRDQLKLYFGTIVSKRTDEQTDNTFWHVVYDDGDEEDYDESELDEALNLYRSHGKRWDKNHSNNQQNLTEEIRTSKDIRTTDNAELKLKKESPKDSIAQRKMTSSENTRQTALASSERNKPNVFNQGQKERNRELQNCCVDISSDDCDLSEETSDDDSVHVVDMVDLTKDVENIGNSVNIVDLTINTDK